MEHGEARTVQRPVPARLSQLAEAREETRTLVIVNPFAAGGRAAAVWAQVEKPLRAAWEGDGELQSVVTRTPGEVLARLREALFRDDVRRVVALGGDGTNHALINALAELQTERPLPNRVVWGFLPVGTGRDWARGLGIPAGDPMHALDHLLHATPKPTDVGFVRGILPPDGQSPQTRTRCFLNIASAGMGGEVGERVNRARRRYPWTFMAATLRTLLTYTPSAVQISVDGEDWYNDTAYVVAVANGTTFGHGMKIAPLAEPDDARFDLVVVRGVARARLFAAFGRVYAGTHLTHPAARYTRGQTVHLRVPPDAAPIGLELDGEPAAGRDLHFEIRPGWLTVLR